MTCPTCGRPLGNIQSNSPMASVQLDIPAALAPAVMSALAIARNAAMMSQAPEAKEGLEALRQDLESRLPASVRAFRPYRWARVCNAVAEHGDFEVAPLNSGSWYSPDWRVQVRAGEQTILSEELGDEAAANNLAQALDDMLGHLS